MHTQGDKALAALEQQIAPMFDESVEYSPDAQLAADDLYRRFLQDPSAYGYWLSNYGALRFSTSKIAALQTIAFWLRNRFDSHPPELLEPVKAILFDYGDTVPAAMAASLGAGQAMFALRFVPEQWPDFWPAILDSADAVVFPLFLCAVCTELASPTPLTLPYCASLKGSLSHHLDRIEQFVFDRLRQGSPTAFKTLAALVRWTNAVWIGDPDRSSVFFGGLGNAETAGFVVDAIRLLLQKPNLNTAVKTEMAGTLCPPDRIGELTTQFEGAAIVLIALAKLVNQAGILLVDEDAGAEYFQLALSYLPLPDAVSGQVLPFISLYVSVGPGDAAGAGVAAIVDRIAQVMEQGDVLERLAAANAEIDSFAHVVSIACFSHPADVLDALESLLKGHNPPARLGALTVSIYVVFHDTKLFTRLIPFLDGIRDQILSWDSSHWGTPNLFAIREYFRFVAELTEKFPPASYPGLIDFLSDLISSGTLDDGLASHFSDLLVKFAANVGRAINREIGPELVERFVTSGQPEFVAVGGHLLRALEPEAAEEALGGSLHMFAGMLSAEADKRHSCLLSLRFIDVLGRDWLVRQSNASRSSVVEFFQTISDLAVADPELLALYVHASWGVLGPECPALVTQLAEAFADAATVQRACGVLGNALHPPTKAEIVSRPGAGPINGGKAAEPDARPLLPFVDQFLGVVQDAGADRNLIGAFLYFAGQAMRCCPEPELVERLCGFVRDVMERRYDSMLLMIHSLSFLTNIASHFPTEITEMFTAAAFNGLFADGFYPAHPVWESYIEKVHIFHQKLLKGNPDGFRATFQAAARAIGAPEEWDAGYLEPVKGRHQSDTRNAYRVLFHELFEAFKGMPY
jgi:hypothetical protein